MCIFIILLISVQSISLTMGVDSGQRIIGGEVTTVERYPFAVSMLYNMGQGDRYFQYCGGSIISSTAILSAAHCYLDFFGNISPPSTWRARVGSSFHSSKGTVHELRQFVLQDFNHDTGEHDLAVVRTLTAITFIDGVVAPVSIAGVNYIVADDDPLWAIGWGRSDYWAGPSEQLRHAQLRAVNREACKAAYAHEPNTTPVTDGMICAGDDRGRGTCSGDSGGPILHHGVVVGVLSWSHARCSTDFPSVYTRISAYSNWIIAAAA